MKETSEKKQNYQKPLLDIILFKNEDIITGSVTADYQGELE